MTYEIVLRPAAERDLEAIAVYTRKQWGNQQAKRYITALRMDIESLASFPMRHTIYRSDQHEFRKLLSGHHLIFYVVDETTVQIIRVLHERMDIKQHL